MESSSKQKIIITTAIFIMLTLLTDQPIITHAQKANSTPYGGTLRIGMFIKPTIIHPVYTTYSRSSAMVDLIFSQLIRLDRNSEGIPDLAEKWDISLDGLEYTFYLRRDVKFHDGIECTADDIKFTYEVIMDPKNESPFIADYSNVEKIEVLDPYILHITLKQPFTTFVEYLDRGILPKHFFQGKDLRNEEFLKNPIGSGPFRFKGKDDKGEIILEAYEDYYDGRPYLDEIVFKPIDSRIINEVSLLREKMDMVNFLSYEQFKHLGKDSTFKTYVVELDYYYALVYDLNDPVLKDKRIRYAIAHGISQERLIYEAVHGYGKPCYGPFHPSSFGYSLEVKPISYDPQKTIRLLEECGYLLNQGDLYRKKDSMELELRIAANIKDANHLNIIKNIIVQLSQVGIKVSYIVYDEYGKVINDIVYNKKKANIYLKLFLGGADPNFPSLYWYSKSKIYPKISLYKNTNLDLLIEKGQRLPNGIERKELYQTIHKIIYNNQPACFLFFSSDFGAISRRFQNTDVYFFHSMPTYAIKDFYVETERR